jgi:hypothetical protein
MDTGKVPVNHFLVLPTPFRGDKVLMREFGRAQNMDENIIITGIQSRLARAALGLNIDKVADLADLGVNTISRFEQKNEVGHVRTVRKLASAYQKLGIRFPDRTSIAGLPDPERAA